jgi:hypothetical protein
MGFRHLMGFGLIFGMLASAAPAADKLVAIVTEAKGDGGTSSILSFEYQGCEEECLLATLTCEPSTAISLVLADIKAKHAAKAMQQERFQIALKAGAKVFDYSITDMQFAELTVAWWLTAREQGSKPQEIAKAIEIARLVEAKVGGWTVKMPVDDTVRKWAAACK